MSTCALVMMASVLVLPDDRVSAWGQWEHGLESGTDYSNPCTDVDVRVTFQGPDGESLQRMAFWDGGRRFVVRCAFPSIGRWTWSSSCSDRANRGLHEQSGVVHVTPASGTNPLERHGHLRVSDDGRLLVYADHTPFLWIGDTCWAAPVHATEEEWRKYVANRAEKGYTVLQLAIAPEWALKQSRRRISPFLSELPDVIKPNPDYFREMDQQLALANEHGLVAMITGLMETPYEYPQPEQVAVFSRYVASRYSAYATVFSPSFDSGIREAETLAAAQAIRDAAPDALVTMHMGTGVGPHFHTAEWLAFDMYQSGHNGGDARRQTLRAIGMAADLLKLAPRKPIVNGEAIYEGEFGGAYDVRRTAWLSFLSGAVGYTAGIDEVYAWEPDAAAKMDVPSSDQVALLGTVLRALPWWDFQPAPARILNQPGDTARLMAFALTRDATLGLGYLPENDTITLDLAGCPAPYDVLWVHPATGEWRDGVTVVPSAHTAMLAPDPRDWALLIAAHGLPAVERVKSALDTVAYPAAQRTASVRFAKDARIAGLVRKSPGDGAFAPDVFEGTECIVNRNPKRNSYLYMDVDDRMAFRGGAPRMHVEARLQSDEPLDHIQLQYDAQGPPEMANVYRAVPPVSTKEDGDWTVVTFTAESPYLGNRQNSGADFRLFLDARLCRIASLTLDLK